MKIFDRKLKSKITVFLKKNLKSCPLCAGQSFLLVLTMPSLYSLLSLFDDPLLLISE